MADLVACLAMSHAPQLMLPPDQWHLLNNRAGENLPEKPELQALGMDWKREQWDACMAAIARLREHLAGLRPDTVVIVGDDQHENFVDDGMPPFTIFLGEEIEGTVSLRYTKQAFTDNRTRYQVDVPLARHLIDGLMDAGFDPAYAKQTRYEGGIGHAFARPFKFLLPEPTAAVVPIMINTYYPPVPSPRRCIQFGQALAEAIKAFPEPRRVALVASGGLSHTKIREELDQDFLRALRDGDLAAMGAMSPADLVEGTSEIRNWIVVAAAAAGRDFELLHHVPLYRTPTGVGCAMGFARWR